MANQQTIEPETGVITQTVFIPQFTEHFLNCTMAYDCPAEWRGLSKTDSPFVRHCPKCARNVTFCTSQTKLDELAKQGECVAFFEQQIRTGKPKMCLGVPSYVFDEDGVGHVYPSAWVLRSL